MHKNKWKPPLKSKASKKFSGCVPALVDSMCARLPATGYSFSLLGIVLQTDVMLLSFVMKFDIT